MSRRSGAQREQVLRLEDLRRLIASTKPQRDVSWRCVPCRVRGAVVAAS